MAFKLPTLPLWLRVSYTLMVCIIVPVYLRNYGPANFLWFSDIWLLVMVPALWLRSSFLASMMAIGVLPLEIPWMISFFSGGTFGDMAGYMFDDSVPLYLRALSLFHFPMPACIIFMLWRFGYNPRALYPQMLLSLSVLLLVRFLTSEQDNINMVFPPSFVRNVVSADTYFTLLLFFLLFVIIIPMHMLLKRYFPLKVLRQR